MTAKCMQKYLFLYCRKQLSEDLFDFVPYKYGCFSFQANQDIVTLSRNGYLDIENSDYSECHYVLNGHRKYIETLDMFSAEAVHEIVRAYGDMSQEELIAYTYRKYPFTAINSVIKERLLTEEELRNVNEMKSRYKNNDFALMSIGYEGFTLEKYLRQLICNDIRLLIDVRKNAFSMKYGFSKSTLSKACSGVGIEYIHIPQLGIESSLRQSLITQSDYDILFDSYERTTLRDNWEYILQVRSLIKSKRRVCLTCFEKDPHQCHRTRVAKALMSLSDVDYKFNDILL